MRSFLFLVFLFFAAPAFAQAPVIVLRNHSPVPEQNAANLLKTYLELMTGRPVEIMSNAKPTDRPVVFIGNQPKALKAGLSVAPDLPEDAYFLEGKNNTFLIAGGGRHGAEYGVYTLLELLGCRKYSPRDSLIPRLPQLRLPDFPAKLEVPAFPYRELWYEPASDPSWARWHKLKTRPEKEAEWGMFVHTFNKLCPPERYFAGHPEYFSWNGAQYSSGQLCLSNDTVKQIVIASLRAMIKEKPEAKYWSVSQNDNYDYCKCARCRESDYQLGGPAGTLLAFVNDVAAKFPDKVISTLAYQYTRRPPRGIKPAGNVSVCLCSIECNRGQTIQEGCNDFASDVKGWSALTQRLMIWDYVVQFRSYASPFPNWHTLQPNLQLFRQAGTEMLFEQGSGSDRSEFSDMRAYLLAKLMWNPDANMDSILTDFGEGYYGAARPLVWQYIHDLSGSLLEKGGNLWIYDIPQNESFLKYPFRLADQLERLDPEQAGLSLRPDQKQHLADARLPLQFAQLELNKVDTTFVRAQHGLTRQKVLSDAIRIFRDGCKTSGIKHLNESGYLPSDYGEDYRRYLEAQSEARRSVAVKVQLASPASLKYAAGSARELINKFTGETDYRYNWLGFEGNDLQATVELSQPWLRHIKVSFLQDQQSWVFFPEKVVFEISNDGVHFETVHEVKFSIMPNGKKEMRFVEFDGARREAKYVRVTAVNIKKCPEWHPCNGNPCWIFADEVVVD